MNAPGPRSVRVVRRPSAGPPGTILVARRLDRMAGCRAWTTAASAATLVPVQDDLLPPGTGAGRMAATLVDGVAPAHGPVISDVVVPGFGEGVSARFLASTGSRDEPAVAGIGYLVAGPSCVVRFMSQPATSTLIGLLQDPLDEVVRTIRVTT